MSDILLVDDNAAFVNLVDEFLSNNGHNVTSLKSTAEVDDAIRQLQSFDLAIVDFWLQNETGIDVISRLRDANPELPCIFVSGGNDMRMSLETSTALAEMNGAKEFLYKPFSLTVLQKAIDKLLAQ